MHYDWIGVINIDNPEIHNKPLKTMREFFHNGFRFSQISNTSYGYTPITFGYAYNSCGTLSNPSNPLKSGKYYESLRVNDILEMKINFGTSKIYYFINDKFCAQILSIQNGTYKAAVSLYFNGIDSSKFQLLSYKDNFTVFQ